MPTNWEDKFVKCPFYRKTDTNSIVCEGLEERNTIHLAFESKQDKKNYMANRCNCIDGCEECPIHLLLDAKWK